MTVKKQAGIVIALLSLIIIYACSDHRLTDEAKRIKEVGNTDPELALLMLDTLEQESQTATLHEQNLIALLKIRLHDKAYHLATSDLAIQKILPYFEKNGSTVEKQEAYYYAGSVYRDIQDTPRALENFFQSLDCAHAEPAECDSVMLNNTYSNLHYLYYNVQDYQNALDMAQHELDMSKKTRIDPTAAYMHVAAACIGTSDFNGTIQACDSAYARIINNNLPDETFVYDLTYLLCYYSQLSQKEKAEKCYNLISMNKHNADVPFYRIALAEYDNKFGDGQIAIDQLHQVLEESDEIGNRHDAHKDLFKIYFKKNDNENALKHANEYILISDSFDYGKRQELAATVSNQYKYHLDKKKMENLMATKNKYSKIMNIAIILFVVSVCLCVTLYTYKRNRHLRKVISLSEELQRITASSNNLQEEIKKKEEELCEQRIILDRREKEIEDLYSKIAVYDKELENTEQMLSEKIEQNKKILTWLHASRLEEEDGDVVATIQQATQGAKQMSANDWKKLYKAVDKLYPTFRMNIINKVGQFTEQHMQVFYLMRIGLSGQEIQHLTNLARVTVWRWMKKYSWITEEQAGNDNQNSNLFSRIHASSS